MSRINSQVMVTIQQFTGITPNDTKASAYAGKVAVENILHFLWKLICVTFLCVLLIPVHEIKILMQINID